MKKLLTITAFTIFIINWKISHQMSVNTGEDITSSDVKGARSRRSAPMTPKAAVKWPMGVIPFIKHESLNPVIADYMDSAMAYLEKVSCLSFIDAANIPDLSTLGLGHTRFVTIEQHPSKCFAALGKGHRNEGGIPIMMHDECGDYSMEPSLHELLHIAGIGHEHERLDRDRYIKVHEENFQKDFELTPSSDSDVTWSRYDISSLMHYPPRTGVNAKARAVENHTMTLTESASILFRKNIYGGSLPLIGPGKTRDADHPMSHRDIAGLNSYYNCAELCLVQLDCQNGGYQDKNCECLCPKHFRGPTCEEFIDDHNSKDCGKSILTANDKWTILTPPRKNGNNFKFNRHCTWLIQGPPGSFIGMKMTKLFLDTKEGRGNRLDGECDPKYKKYGNDILYVYLFGTDIDYFPISCEDKEYYLRKISMSDTNKLVIEWKSDVKYKTKYGFETDKKQAVANNPGWKLKYKIFKN